MTLVRHTLAILWRELARSRHRLVLTYLVPIGPPVVAVTLFADLMSPATRLPSFPTSTYQDYVAAGAVLLPGMMAAGLTATGTGEDLRGGFADRMRLLGVTATAATLGRLTFEGIRILPAAAIAYLAAVGLGDDLVVSAGSLVVLLMLAATWAMAYNGIFHLLAALTRSPHAPIALQPLFAPITFLSVFWFPAELMPSWGETVASYNPISWLTDAALAFTINDVDTGVVLAGVATIAVTAVVFMTATVRTIERGYTR